jgi:hypothetical protein
MRLWIAAIAIAASGAAAALTPARRPQLTQPLRHDISAPLTLMRAAEAEEPREDREPGRVPLPERTSAAEDPVVQRSAPGLLMPQSGLNFEGLGQGFVGPSGGPGFTIIGDPPDPQGDVGPSHYVQIVNSSFAVFSKQGTMILGPVPTRTLFAGFGAPCEKSDDGDGIVLYDPLADRWLVTQFAVPRGQFVECIAVSRTGDPTGAWARYAYAYSFFNDYPKFGVWPDAYFATYNAFASQSSGVFRGVELCAFDRARMLAGEVAAQQCLLADSDGVSGMSPADFDGTLPPPEGEPGFALGFSRDSLLLYRYHVDWQRPEESTVELTQIPVAPFTPACDTTRSGVCVPQMGARSPPLDALADRIMFRVAYRNMGGYEALVANHTVNAGASSGVRWYELRDPAGDPAVFQQGTYAPDSASRWLGSIAMDRAGGIGLGFSISSTAQRPGLAYTGRLAGDSPGVMAQGEAPAFTGGGSQMGSLRWGDYSSLSVDPADDCTFWYTGEYIPSDGSFNWHTRIVTFQLPGCTAAPDFAVWISPALRTLGPGRETTYAVRTAALRPAAAARTLALSIDGLPEGVKASLGDLIVSPGQSTTLTVRAAPGVASGQVPLRVRAAAAEAERAGSAVASLVASDFAVDVQASASVFAGVRSSIRVDTRLLFGEPEALLFSASHLPRGVTAEFFPAGVLSGSPATLRLVAEPNLSAASTDVRITAIGPAASHTAILHVRALASPRVNISWPLTTQNLKGKAQIIATAAASVGTSITDILLFVDDVRQGESDHSPAVFDWDTRAVDDGVHHLVVQATDAAGSRASVRLAVWVQNGDYCGCSSRGGGWEALGLLGLLVLIRPRRRRFG